MVYSEPLLEKSFLILRGILVRWPSLQTPYLTVFWLCLGCWKTACWGGFYLSISDNELPDIVYSVLFTTHGNDLWRIERHWMLKLLARSKSIILSVSSRWMLELSVCFWYHFVISLFVVWRPDIKTINKFSLFISMSKSLMMKKYAFEFTLHEFKPRFFYAKLLYTNRKGKKTKNNGIACLILRSFLIPRRALER